MKREELARNIGLCFARLVSGNNQPHMSGDPFARIPPLLRDRFDDACLKAADLALAAALTRPESNTP